MCDTHRWGEDRTVDSATQGCDAKPLFILGRGGGVGGVSIFGSTTQPAQAYVAVHETCLKHATAVSPTCCQISSPGLYIAASQSNITQLLTAGVGGFLKHTGRPSRIANFSHYQQPPGSGARCRQDLLSVEVIPSQAVHDANEFSRQQCLVFGV